MSKGRASSPLFRDTLFNKHKGRCFYCNIELTRSGLNQKSDFVCEHLTPLKRGGADDEQNIVASCSGCNINKGNRTLDEYVSYLKESGTISPVLSGRIGGLKTAKKYGANHYKKIAKARHRAEKRKRAAAR